MARTVADAVLYEGYLLYPYRATATKNQVRWQFGVLGPPGASTRGVGEEPDMHAECLVEAKDGARVTVHLRFLQLQARGVEQPDPDSPGRFTPVTRLHVNGVELLSWDEAVDHEVELGPFELRALSRGLPLTVEIPGGEEIEAVSSPDGETLARVVRRRWPLVARVHLQATNVEAAPGVHLLAVHVDNAGPGAADRTAAVRTSLLGAHLLLQVTGAAFISLLEPPAELVAAAAASHNRRCWPVLVGAQGRTDIVLVSPIILYDYPEVAPESAGALFDSTEIDEILTLRVLTLTDEEKAAARATDPAAAAIIDRCEMMSPADLQRLHGVLRDPRAAFGGTAGPGGDDIPTFVTPGEGSLPGQPPAPWWDPGQDAAVSPTTDAVVIDGVAVARGSRVRLRPGRRADAQDLFFAEREATVSAVYSDVDGGTHVAVVLVDDPAADLHDWYGRYLYFAPDEIQPLDRPSRTNEEEMAP